jgi:hypothetical protein
MSTYQDSSPLDELKKALAMPCRLIGSIIMIKLNPQGINQYSAGISAEKDKHTKLIRDKLGLRHADAEGLYNQGYRINEDGDLQRSGNSNGGALD